MFDPKALANMDSKILASIELDPKTDGRKKGPGRPPLDDTLSSRTQKISYTGVVPSYNSMASLGLDPKNPMAALAALDLKNPNSLATL